MHIQIIVGSIREGRKAKTVGDWAYQFSAKRENFSVELIDLKDWDLPMFDFSKPPIMGDYENPLQQQWADKIAQGDGYLFISPEYNHGYTPVLKNALDYIYGEWGHKPASFITYGGAGGARGIEQLRLVLIELNMVPLRESLHISNLWNKFKNGFFEGDKSDVKQLNKVLEAILWWGNALKEARKTL
ncbi:NADPH-dependent FMN reductase [Salibacterium halotolerans]|uniref:NAD(P)H-dependent FMN reductase n=1 Tax=Salibacterium halotolerans TaxID=1884432 RepID=A0A1I5YDX5_9BACI|nr:NAD(P)H-dependent oxidoreductase [Salibacterium halotolerans]SFQ42435.1 NAD(P)H-dependent FMN reductase [Salibacterium halotolerans]